MLLIFRRPQSGDVEGDGVCFAVAVVDTEVRTGANLEGIIVEGAGPAKL